MDIIPAELAYYYVLLLLHVLILELYYAWHGFRHYMWHGVRHNFTGVRHDKRDCYSGVGTGGAGGATAPPIILK